MTEGRCRGSCPDAAERELLWAGFGRSAERLAAELLVLSARPEAACVQPDAYSWEEIRHVADTLRGMALRCAVEAGDRQLALDVIRRVVGRPRGDTTGSA